MNANWDLQVLYQDFDDPAFGADFCTLDELIAQLQQLAAQATKLSHTDLICRYLELSSRMTALAGKLGDYVFLRYATNTSDAKANNYNGQLMAKLSSTSSAQAVLSHTIAGFDDLDAIIDKNASLEEFRYLLTNIKRDSKHLLGEKEEEVFSRMNISGAAAWEDLWNTLTSTVQVAYQGKQLPLSAARNLAYDPDQAVRKEAFEAELACYPAIQEAGAAALNSIKLQVINECELRGFDSPLDKALYDARMKRETLDALISAMEEYLPKFWQYLRAKAKAMGHQNGLPWYDLFAPMGKSDRKYTVDQARDYLLKVFGAFDTQLHDMVKRAFDEAWIDFYPKAGKVGGAFDEGVPAIGQSRVLTNFDGGFGDIVTLAHELGHAFHDQQVFSHNVLNQDYSMPVAETASTFNEVVTVSTAIDAANDPDTKLALIESQLMDACQIICDIYSRYLFETSVFDHRKEEFLSADRLCELMLDAQKKAYGDGLDPDCLHPYMWLCKSHYYSGAISFYNFPYAFGGLFARGLYAKYRAQGTTFVPTYKAMLHATPMCDVEEAAKIAGVDLTDRNFWVQGLQMLSQEIDQFCALLAQK